MNELLSKPLAQIVNEHHGAASVFEKYHLDYCCRGNRSLAEACTESHLPINDLVTEVEGICAHKKNELDFNRIKLYQLADYIVYTHHSYVKRAIPRILSQLEIVSSAHGSRYNYLYKICGMFVELANDMSHHMHNEESLLFPRIKQIELHSLEPIFSEKKYFEYLSLPIIDLEGEHVEAGNRMAEIRSLTNNYLVPTGAGEDFKMLFTALGAFEADLHHHVHLENSILFPKAIALEKELTTSPDF
jgi:regulator of cell morphogenesis and NO signaling